MCVYNISVCICVLFDCFVGVRGVASTRRANQTVPTDNPNVAHTPLSALTHLPEILTNIMNLQSHTSEGCAFYFKGDIVSGKKKQGFDNLP